MARAQFGNFVFGDMAKLVHFMGDKNSLTTGQLKIIFAKCQNAQVYRVDKISYCPQMASTIIIKSGMIGRQNTLSTIIYKKINYVSSTSQGCLTSYSC